MSMKSELEEEVSMSARTKNAPATAVPESTIRLARALVADLHRAHEHVDVKVQAIADLPLPEDRHIGPAA